MKARDFVGAVMLGLVGGVLIGALYSFLIFVFPAPPFSRTLHRSLIVVGESINWGVLVGVSALVLLFALFRLAEKLIGPRGQKFASLLISLFVTLVAVYLIFEFRRPIACLSASLLPARVFGAIRKQFLAALIAVPSIFICSRWVMARSGCRRIAEELRRLAGGRMIRWTCAGSVIVVLVINILASVFWRRIPNIILVTVDTVRQDHLGYFGYGRGTSPNIDRLGRSGITFIQATSFSNWTLPSHENLFTGLYPVSVLISKVPTHRRILPRILRWHGYHTAAFVSGAYCTRKFGLNQGFDLYDDKFPGGERKVGDYYDAILRWLDREAERPFFLWLHLFEPHFPYEVYDQHVYGSPEPTRFDEFNNYRGGGKIDIDDLWENKLDLDERDIERAESLYDGEISYIDSYLGRFLDDLKERGLFDNSMIIVTSDHGEGFGEHGVYFSHGKGVTEDMTRVPLIIKMPGNSPGGKVVNAQVQTSDIFATVLDIAHISLREELLSKSLLPLVSDSGGSVRRYAYSYSKNGKSYSVRDTKYKLVYSDEGGEYSLYDLNRDPGETTDIAADEPEVLQSMSEELVSFRQGFSLFEARNRGEEEPEIDEETRQNLSALGYIH